MDPFANVGPDRVVQFLEPISLEKRRDRHSVRVVHPKTHNEIIIRILPEDQSSASSFSLTLLSTRWGDLDGNIGESRVVPRQRVGGPARARLLRGGSDSGRSIPSEINMAQTNVPAPRPRSKR